MLKNFHFSKVYLMLSLILATLILSSASLRADNCFDFCQSADSPSSVFSLSVTDVENAAQENFDSNVPIFKLSLLEGASVNVDVQRGFLGHAVEDTEPRLMTLRYTLSLNDIRRNTATSTFEVGWSSVTI